MANIFEKVKDEVTVRDAAMRYGLKTNRGNKVCCIFHNDRTPSMMLNERYYYCFGCGAHGDAIDLTAKLFGLSNYEAARKLAKDFGIDIGDCARGKPSSATQQRKYLSKEEIRLCRRVLQAYLDGLELRIVELAPKEADEPFDGRFVSAVQFRDRCRRWLDVLDTGTQEERQKVVEELTSDKIIALLKMHIERGDRL